MQKDGSGPLPRRSASHGSRRAAQTRGERAAKGLGTRAGSACRTPYAHAASALVIGGLFAAASYEMWRLLRSVRELGDSMAESSAGVIAQLGATLEEILAQAGASLVRLARAAEANVTATLPWVAAAVVGVVITVACEAVGHLLTTGELSVGGQGPRAGSGACRTPFAQASKAEVPAEKSVKNKVPVDFAAVIAARGRMSARRRPALLLHRAPSRTRRAARAKAAAQAART